MVDICTLTEAKQNIVTTVYINMSFFVFFYFKEGEILNVLESILRQFRNLM